MRLMEKQQPVLDAKSSVKIAECEKLKKVGSDHSNLSTADKVYVESRPLDYRLPGVPRAPFVHIYEGDALSWGPEADEGILEAYAAFKKALRGHPLNLSRCIQRVLTAAAAVPSRLEWLALSERARKDVQGTTLPPLIIDEVRTRVGRYYLKVQLEEHGRMARVLWAHAAEVQLVMGDEELESMLQVAERMFARAAYDIYDATRIDSGNSCTRSAKAAGVSYTTSYLMEIPDCHKCGKYDCQRCGRRRQLQLIELYEMWEELVTMMVIRVDARAAKERQRLLHAKKMEIAKARYGKTW